MNARNSWRLAAAGLSIMAPSAQAQTLGAVEQRLDRLEKAMRQVNERDGGHAPETSAPQSGAFSQAALSYLEQRMAALERVVSELVSKEEEDRRSLSDVRTQLQRIVSDAETRFQAAEQRQQEVSIKAPERPSTNTSVQSVEASKTVLLGADDRYSIAMDFVSRQDWGRVKIAFEEFIATYPDDPRTPQARYWVGRSFGAQGQPREAARIYLELFQKFPQAEFAADNLFGLAAALEALGSENRDQVCGVYGEIQANYREKITQDQRARLLDERLRLNCAD